MVLYQCEFCGYTTDRKNNLKNHVNRKNKCFLVKKPKNDSMLQSVPHNTSQKKKIPSQNLTNLAFSEKFPHKTSQIDPHKPSQTLTKFSFHENENPEFKYLDNEHQVFGNLQETEINFTSIEKNEYDKISLTCEYCKKTFKRRDNLRRHIDKYCRNFNDLKNQNAQLIEEKLILEKKVEKLSTALINKPTQIINNTININGFGNENMNYISEKYIRQLMSIPFNALPMLIKDIHFNPNHPENHNIRKTNRKDKYISNYQNGKWTYEDKNKLLDTLIDEKMAILENSVQETIDENIDKKRLERFEEFKGQYYNDETIKASSMNEAELIILNNSKDLKN